MPLSQTAPWPPAGAALPRQVVAPLWGLAFALLLLALAPRLIEAGAGSATAPPAVREPARPRPQPVAFSVARPRPDFTAELRRLAVQTPASDEPLRARYLAATDLEGFLRELLPAAEAGDRGSEYYVYLVLDQCQSWLHLDAGQAQAMQDRMALELEGRPAEERQQWESESRRCRAFAGADLGELRIAMGDELPGAEVEYSSIWFWRAVLAGYPPALAEAALRNTTLGDGERIRMLQEAVASGDADVYWNLFFHNSGEAPASASVVGVAWLILACRAGYDCTAGADWFRDVACAQDGARCEPAESALEHYWRSLSPDQRALAWQLAAGVERDRRAGRLGGIPLPFARHDPGPAPSDMAVASNP